MWLQLGHMQDFFFRDWPTSDVLSTHKPMDAQRTSSSFKQEADMGNIPHLQTIGTTPVAIH